MNNNYKICKKEEKMFSSFLNIIIYLASRYTQENGILSRATNVINQSDIWINGFDFIHKDNRDDLQISVFLSYWSILFNAITLPPTHWMQTAYRFKAYSSGKVWNENLMNMQSISPWH